MGNFHYKYPVISYVVDYQKKGDSIQFHFNFVCVDAVSFQFQFNLLLLHEVSIQFQFN